jgi:hypothetical protein
VQYGAGEALDDNPRPAIFDIDTDKVSEAIL